MSIKTDELIKRAESELSKLDIESVKRSGILPGQGKEFFPVVSYPPAIMYEPMSEAEVFGVDQSLTTNPMIGYLHMPFCPSRCTFCHWITNTKSKDDVVETYIDYLEKEMLLYKARLGVDKIPVSSVLWGGGTPTYPKPAQLERLLKSYTTHFDLSQCTQFSVEAEPTTLIGEEGKLRLKHMKDYGVDRISLGVQSFDEGILRRMGRSHTHEETLEALDNIREAGFNNSYIDMIYAYPGQTITEWVEAMQQIATLDIDGYQLYRLRITPTGDRKGNIVNMLEKKPDTFHEVNDIYLMKYLGAMISEENGFHEFQRRIFSKQPGTSSHYLRDWFLNLYDVVGVGVSAWSTVSGVFSLNIGDKDLNNYYQYLDKQQLPINRGKILNFDDYARRSFMLPLKNDYLDKKSYQDKVGADPTQLFSSELSWMKELGMIEESEDRLSLTQRGGFFADEVTTQFFNPDYVLFDDIQFAPGRKVLTR